ncbi:hypothetical protein BKP44_02695 [Formosa algae]|nr:hypothetical protein BKP44_02695 [Formosa algae]
MNMYAQQLLYISPNGNDTNKGTKAEPLATLTAARDAIREIKKIHLLQHKRFMLLLKTVCIL